MKKFVSFCLVALLFAACSTPEISPEAITQEGIAEKVNPQFDLSQSYYAHFVVRLEDGTSATINSIELDASHWTVDEAERVIPNIVHIQEALGYEAFETLRGQPVKGTEISINTAASMSAGGSAERSSGGFSCPDYADLYIPRCQCLNQLSYHASLAHISPYAFQIGDGFMVYCDATGGGNVSGVAWLSHEIVNAF